MLSRRGYGCCCGVWIKDVVQGVKWRWALGPTTHPSQRKGSRRLIHPMFSVHHKALSLKHLWPNLTISVVPWFASGDSGGPMATKLTSFWSPCLTLLQSQACLLQILIKKANWNTQSKNPSLSNSKLNAIQVRLRSNFLVLWIFYTTAINW